MDIKKDVVNHPAHYTDGKIEVIDFIEDKKLNFHRGNAVKYIARAGKKDPDKEIEDLKKAAWYITREIKRLTKQYKDNAEHCVACGDVIPEGRQICPQCESGAIIGVDLADKSDASHGGL